MKLELLDLGREREREWLVNVTILILQGRQEGKEERKGIVNLFPGVYSSSSKLNFFKVFRMEEGEGEEANLKNEYFNRSAR